MAPTKSTRAIPIPKQAAAVRASSTSDENNMLPLATKGLTRRTQTQIVQNVQDQNVDLMPTRGKRKADQSPLKNEKVKRSALGNLTNNVKVMSLQPPSLVAEEGQKLKKEQQQQLITQVLKETQNKQPQPQPNKIATRAASRNNKNSSKPLDKETCTLIATAAPNTSVIATATNKKRDAEHLVVPAAPPPPPPAVAQAALKAQHKPMRRISNEFNKTEESLYMSALEDISSCESMRLSGNFEAAKRRSLILQQQQQQLQEEATKTDATEPVTMKSTLKQLDPAQVETPPLGVDDFDKANWNDPLQVSHYAMDIFIYLKSRESQFPIDDYMSRQTHLSKWMRSLLVDWMVEVQETFELNHETLYLAVKIVDLFLCRVVIQKDKLQLLGAAALFIACKYDERTPPLIEDFLYICDGAYKHNELIQMEMKTLRTIDYDLGIPLSYRFLRRYARCARVPMPTLTLARYILELSLMDYATVSSSDSQLASAVLFMALRLHGEKRPWTPALVYYSGYMLADFADLVPLLNAGLHRKPKGTIKTIRSKYSHKIFHEVAKVPLMTTEQLFEHNLNLDVSIKLDG